MRFSVAATAAALVAGAAAGSNGTVYTTEVVSYFTTYCPYSTQVSHNGITYTVSEATTLTITNCPCTVTHPISSSSTPVAPVSTPAPYTTSPAPVPSVGTVSPVSYSNGTTPINTPTLSATASASATTSGPVQQTTNAAAGLVAPGAGIAAIFGLAALAL